uniref:Molybdopterin synthase catalytic subunit n=1 Tax=Panagrolaimus sp. PS1159 TaxID=55785 RepID=A0AC35EUF6_9BILA
MKRRATIFGISGCTNAGKTTISNQLVQRLKEKHFIVAHVCQDDFFKSPENVQQIQSKDLPTEFFYHYDEPDAVNSVEMANFIENLAKENDIIIVEGNMLCELKNVESLLDEIVFFTMTKEECEKRRSTRSYDPADKPGYFEQIVWPAYEEHYSNAMKRDEEDNKILFISGTDPLEEIAAKVYCKLQDVFKDFVRIQFHPISSMTTESFVNLPNCGAISTFIGTTRDNFNNKQVHSLEYECYESMAYSELKNVCQKTREKFPEIKRISIFHRIGKVDIGEASVIISTSSPHRREAIEGTHFAIDILKEIVPIFKKEIYADGTKSWKENSEFDNFKDKLQCNGCCGDAKYSSNQ